MARDATIPAVPEQHEWEILGKQAQGSQTHRIFTSPKQPKLTVQKICNQAQNDLKHMVTHPTAHQHRVGANFCSERFCAKHKGWFRGKVPCASSRWGNWPRCRQRKPEKAPGFFPSSTPRRLPEMGQRGIFADSEPDAKALPTLQHPDFPLRAPTPQSWPSPARNESQDKTLQRHRPLQAARHRAPPPPLAPCQQSLPWAKSPRLQR